MLHSERVLNVGMAVGAGLSGLAARRLGSRTGEIT